VAFLALATRPLARSYVSQSLWPEASERHADGNLRSALWKVGHLDSLPIEASGGQLALGSAVAVDYRRSVTLARRLQRDPGLLHAPELDEQAFTHDLLPDWYEEWVVAERERYRQLRLHALEQLCKELVGRRRFAQAVQAGLAAVAGEPLRESATFVLLRGYLAEGNAGEAIRQYESFTHLLWDELKVSPSRAMTEMVETLRPR
jgi:DNA-binding SARP family transcriptional activator